MDTLVKKVLKSTGMTQWLEDEKLVKSLAKEAVEYIFIFRRGRDLDLTKVEGAAATIFFKRAEAKIIKEELFKQDVFPLPEDEVDEKLLSFINADRFLNVDKREKIRSYMNRYLHHVQNEWREKNKKMEEPVMM